jgi:tRNA (guanosine-2'-O-)-methyltransferase
MDHLSTGQKKALYEHLSAHLSDAKKELFSQVWSQRNSALRLVLENIYQPLNASAILRTADALGVHWIDVIDNEHPWTINRKIAKGALDWLKIQNHSNVEKVLLDLKAKGYMIAVTDFSPEAISIYDFIPEQPVALVMGTELSGISSTVKQCADVSLVIPMSGFSQSLNVSVAAGVALSHLSTSTKRISGIHRFTDEEKWDTMVQWASHSIYWSDTLIKEFLENQRTNHSKAHL